MPSSWVYSASGARVPRPSRPGLPVAREDVVRPAEGRHHRREANRREPQADRVADLVRRRPGLARPADVGMHRPFEAGPERDADLHELRLLAVERPLGEARVAQLLVGLDDAGMLGCEGPVGRRKLLFHVESSSRGTFTMRTTDAKGGRWLAGCASPSGRSRAS